MKAYDSLSTFPDADAGLKALESDNSISAYIFSNGANAMVASSVKDSPSLSPFSHVFKDIITVEDDRAFKPVMEVYLSMARKVDGGHGLIRKEKIWLVSSNPFDIVGAKVVGMKAAWVDRKGTGWHDRLGDLAAGGPTIIVKGVDEAVAGIKEWEKKKKNGI
jgi:2-haloacid dehalogenase